MPVQMTRAEYTAKYGAVPDVSPIPAPAPPVQMTHAEYMAKYGGAVATPTAAVSPAQSPFQSPLQNIASGDAATNLETTKGLIKGAAQTFASAGAQNAGPIGTAMLKNAPAFAKDIAGFNQAVQPSNPAQVFGIGSERTAELALPADAGVSALSKLGGATNDIAKTIETLTPKMTVRETADALASRGGTKSGILGNIKLNPDPSVKRIADTVMQYVPDFSPKKSLVENVNAVRTATDGIAQQLKQDVVASGHDSIYTYKELRSALDEIPKPTLLVGDLEKVYARVVDKAVEIARSNGGRVSDLFQARKDFDEFVSQQFPNLYSSDTLTPMRSAIKNIRNAMTDFTAEHLPKDVNLHDRLKIQNHLLDAIENMASKAKTEIGTNAIERATTAIKNHPVLGAVGGVAAYEAAKKIPIIGGILP